MGIAEIGQFLIFKITVVHYITFEKFKFLSDDCVQRAPACHPAKFSCNRLNGYIKMACKI